MDGVLDAPLDVHCGEVAEEKDAVVELGGQEAFPQLEGFKALFIQPKVNELLMELAITTRTYVSIVEHDSWVGAYPW